MKIRLTTHLVKILNIDFPATWLIESEGFPWNGWIVTEEGYAEFRTGIFYEALKHLEKCRLCLAWQEDLGITKEDVEKKLKEIEETWRKIMQ